MPIQSETRPSMLLIEPRNSEYMISVEVQYQWPLQYITSYYIVLEITTAHTHKARGRGSVPVAPATRYFVLVLKITTAQTQG